MYLVNISNAVRHSKIISAPKYQRDCAALFELTYVSQNKDIELISLFLSIFVLPNTHGCKRTSSTHLQKDLPILVDHWFVWKHNIGEKERIPDPTTFLKVAMKNVVPDKDYSSDILTLIGDTPNKKIIMSKLSRYEDFCLKRLCHNIYLQGIHKLML